jgi:DNA-binding MarR family transcriptional regulator
MMQDRRARAGGAEARPAGGSRGYAETDIAGRLHAAAVHLLRRVRQSDVRSGLSGAQGSALSVLVFGGPRTIGELAAAEQVAAPTMTRLITGLEAGGYVRRRVAATDRRSVIVQATAKGRRALERSRRLRVEQVDALLFTLTASERAIVAESVTLLERALGR